MNRVKFFSFYFILITVLTLRFWYFYANRPQFEAGQRLNFETTIFSQPQLVGSQQSFIANYHNQKIKIITSRFPELNYSDYIFISGLISSQHDRVIMYFPEIKTTQKPAGIWQSGLKSINIFREKIISLLSTTLPSPASSLMLGIIFGIKEQMPQNFSNNLKVTGVFHVIAASGMNVALVGGFVSGLLAIFLKRQIAIGLSILAIFVYCLLAGMEPSIVRASIMGAIVFSSQILGRQNLAANSLFLTGFLMLLIDPTLLSDVGFQLSFVATFGILYIKPLLNKKEGIFSEVATTIAVQIATLPILMANFGIYSIWSILVNAAVLWTVPIIMIFGGIGTVLGLILKPLGQCLIMIGYPLLLYFELIVNFFGKLGGVLMLKNFSWQLSLGYYCMLISFLFFFKKK